MEYTAPLWSHALQQQQQQQQLRVSSGANPKWFTSSTAWTGWINQSRASTITTTTNRTSSRKTPEQSTSRSQSRDHQIDEFGSDNQDAILDSINRYIALRGTLPPHLRLGAQAVGNKSSDATVATLNQDELGKLRAQAKKKGLNVVEHQIKLDQRAQGVDTGEIEDGLDEVAIVPVQTPRDAMQEKGAVALDPTETTSTALIAQTSTTPLPSHIDARRVIESLYATLCDGESALSHLYKSEVVPEMPHSASDAARLEALWQHYRAQVETSAAPDIDSSHQLDLAFLAFLATVGPTGDNSYLTVALRVLQDLLELSVIDHAAVAAPPTWLDQDGIAPPQDVVLRAVLLRTVATVALGSRHNELALHAVTALTQLKVRYDVPVEVQKWSSDSSRDSIDTSLLVDVAMACIDDLRWDRAHLYDAARPAASPANSTRALGLLAQLLDQQVPQLLVAPDLPSPVATMLNAFVDECAAHKRLDLVARMWRIWGTPGGRAWRIKKRRKIGLGRYLSGDDFADPEPGGYATPDFAKTRRVPVRAREFAILARETGEELQSGTGSHEDWSVDAKRAWIELLVQSRAAQRSQHCFEEARRAYEIWSASGFVLGGRLTLVLAKAAIKFGEKAFAQRLAGDLIATLTRVDSPYRRADPKLVKRGDIKDMTGATMIPHYDLTALAGVYALLGDVASVAQVYRQLLAQKILPDQRDVDVILEMTPVLAQGQDDSLVALVRWAHALGVVITKGHFERMIARLCRVDKDDEAVIVASPEAGRNRVEVLLQLAKDVGLLPSERSQLKSFARLQLRKLNPAQQPEQDSLLKQTRLTKNRRDLAAQMQHATTGHVHPARVVQLLNDALASHDWRTCLAIHETAIRVYGFQDDYTVRRTLGVMLRQFQRESVRGREAIRRGFVSVLESLFDDEAAAVVAAARDGMTTSLCVVEKRETANVVFRAALKLDDVEALERLVQRVDVKPGVEVREVVRRWAIARAGVDRVEEMEGWLGDEQRKCSELKRSAAAQAGVEEQSEEGDRLDGRQKDEAVSRERMLM